MSQWLCTICYYEHDSEQPPSQCPQCDSGTAMFVAMDETGMGGVKAEFAGLPKDLEETRDRARKRLKGFCAVYPHCDGHDDRICQRETYGKAIGFGGAGTGRSFKANFESLEKIQLNTRLVGEHFVPDTSFDFFGRMLTMPVLGASTSGVGRYNNTVSEQEFCRASVRGCREAGTLSMRGDTFFYTPEEHPALDVLEAEGGDGVPIFKPRSQDVLMGLIERAQAAGCPAVGIDLDGCGSTIMNRMGQPVFRKTVDELAQLVQSTSLPFIVKGIMTPQDAQGCVDAGVAVVAVSNHGGRVLDSTPGVAEVLPSIVQQVAGRAMVTADGGVRTGYDVLKMLALGADAVLIGRDIIRAAVGGGSYGVKLHMERVHQVLMRAMLMTGCADLKCVDSKVLY